MKILSNELRVIGDKLRLFYSFPGVDQEEKFKRNLSLYGAFLVSPFLLAFGVFQLNQGNTFLGGYLIISGICMGSSALLVGYFSNTQILSGVNLAFAGTLFIYLLATSGPYGQMGLWLFIYPVAVFFMLGLKFGILLNSVFLASVLILLIFQEYFPTLVPLNKAFKLRFIFSFFIVTFLSFAYEMTRLKYQKGVYKRQLELKQAADLLEEKVKERTIKLERTLNRLKQSNLELILAKNQADKANRSKSEFLANMSHELRTPLNHIIGFTEMVIDKTAGPLNTSQEEFLNDVLGSGRHLLSLINDLLDLAKIEAGKMELKASEIPLENLLRDSLNLVRVKAQKRRIALNLRFQEIPLAVWGDERKIKQILYNLLSNAVKFTPDGGMVEVKVQGMEASGIQITVSDTGIGLSEKDLERIFQPFEQGDNSASRKYQGTGLGLSLTKRLVELHGGRIWAESEGPGRGSRFLVLIPPPVEKNKNLSSIPERSGEVNRKSE